MTVSGGRSHYIMHIRSDNFKKPLPERKAESVAMEYTLNRSKRKTIALYIRDGGLEVRAPLKMPKHEIDRFVASKEKWINDKLAKSNERAALRESFTLGYGDFVAYRGGQFPIEAKGGNRIGFDDVRFYMPPDLAPEQIKSACVMIYRMLARRDLTEKAHLFAKRMSVAPAIIRITGAKTRWGSCSAKKSINFSWRLIMADDQTIDYVVVHELAHLMEMNHSPQFWKIVEGIIPDYKALRARLRELQIKLGAEDWD